MAEAIVNTHLKCKWQAYSAGTKPAGYVHPLATKALAEIGIRHKGLSKHVDEYRYIAFDLVIIVCDSASEECPIWLGPGRRVHMGYPDPAKATGTQDEVFELFRQVRDDIERQVPEFLSSSN